MITGEIASLSDLVLCCGPLSEGASEIAESLAEEYPHSWSEGATNMSTYGDCRRSAVDCLRLARSAQNPFHKALLVRMAASWAALADLSLKATEEHGKGQESSSSTAA